MSLIPTKLASFLLLSFTSVTLIHTPSQHNTYATQLLATIQQALHIHSQRFLSVQGRATVVNTLLPSKFWHALRLVWFPVSYAKLKSMIGKFLMRRMFPLISYANLCLPCHCGGLGMLDLSTQQASLQFRWLLPLLCPVTQYAPLPILWLCAYFSHYMSLSSSFYAPDYVFLFFSPAFRSALHLPHSHSFNLLFSAFDRLPLPQLRSDLSPATCLCLPLSSIWISSTTDPTPARPGLKRLTVADAYYYDPLTQSLQRRPWTDRPMCPYLLSHFFCDVNSHHIIHSPFFIHPCTPHMNPQSLYSDTVDIPSSPLTTSFFNSPLMHSFSSQVFRSICHPPPMPNSSSPAALLSPSKWKAFWKAPMSHVARNIWFCLLHGRLSSSSLLYRIMPTIVLSPSCRLCSHPRHSPDHFLVTCPRVWPVWMSVLPYRLNIYTLLQTDIIQHLHSFSLSPNGPLTSSQVYGAILQAIWHSYWASHFHNSPFITSTVSELARSLLTTLIRENKDMS